MNVCPIWGMRSSERSIFKHQQSRSLFGLFTYHTIVVRSGKNNIFLSPDRQVTTFIKIIISPVQQLFKNFLCLTIKIIRPLPAAIRLIRTAWGKDGSYKKMLVHFQTASQHFYDFSTEIFPNTV